ncbi:hypothetical protein BGZ60DRAFT_451086 [Tricladium varicosporioides]|nr:hypothetical protein BGZ60DRAFT_451086 [Hymenoscyphus varicosporioides]
MTTSNKVSISIQPAAEADLPAVIEFVHESKLALPINHVLFYDWPNNVAQQRVYRNAVESSFKEPSDEIFKAIDNKTGSIVGHLVLSHKEPAEGKSATVDGSDEIPKAPDGMNQEVFNAVVKYAPEMDTEKSVDHFVITHIFVKISHRRQGIGAQLIHYAIERAEKAGVPLSVCSEPAAHQFFLKQGLKDITHADIDLRKWVPELSGFGIFRMFGMAFKN